MRPSWLSPSVNQPVRDGEPHDPHGDLATSGGRHFRGGRESGGIRFRLYDQSDLIMKADSEMPATTVAA